MANVFGDYNLVCPAILFAEQVSFLSPHCNYYSYRLTRNVVLPYSAVPSWAGVPHGTDLYYLFAIPLLAKDAEASQLSRDMIQAWTQFAKSGHPGKVGGVEWTHAMNHLTNDPTTEHLNLDPADYKIVKKYFSEVCNSFWKPKIFN